MQRWFHADPSRWDEFAARYRAELATRPEMLRDLAALAEAGVVTLLFASRNEKRNNATVLRDRLLAMLRGDATGA